MYCQIEYLKYQILPNTIISNQMYMYICNTAQLLLQLSILSRFYDLLFIKKALQYLRSGTSKCIFYIMKRDGTLTPFYCIPNALFEVFMYKHSLFLFCFMYSFLFLFYFNYTYIYLNLFQLTQVMLSYWKSREHLLLLNYTSCTPQKQSKLKSCSHLIPRVNLDQV